MHAGADIRPVITESPISGMVTPAMGVDII
jgi:hypothetical protein